MDKIDVRSVSDKERELLRRQVISMRKKGLKNKDIAYATGIPVETCCRWWKRYEREGQKALSVPKRGRKNGQKRKLSSTQEQNIQRMIIDKCPDQYKLPFALWDRKAVMLLIERECGLRLPVRTIGDYLKRWGFTIQRPTRRAYEQRPKAVRQWKEKQYPEFAARAKAEGGEILWCDESGLSTNGNLARGYASKGKTPELRINARKEHISMISAVSNRGKMRWMLYENAMNSHRLIEFMKRLIHSTDRKVFLIMDNLRVHHSKPVKKWLAENTDKIEVSYLPAYSPELNPDEYLNSDLKAAVHGNNGGVVRSKTAMRKKAASRLKHLQKSPEKVRRFFNHPKVRYADI